jgi:hypothetical protein
MLTDWNPEATNSVFTWEHVLMMFEQEAQHAIENEKKTIEVLRLNKHPWYRFCLLQVHPLLPEVQISPAALNRIQTRLMLLNTELRPRDYRKAPFESATRTYVEDMVDDDRIKGRAEFLPSGHRNDPFHGRLS